MTDDPIRQAGMRRYVKLQIAEEYERANLKMHILNGDSEAEEQCVQNIANAEAEKRALEIADQQHTAAMNPPQAPVESKEVRDAKRWDQCNWGDSYEWASKSKYGVDNAGFQRGMAEVAARRQRGE